MAIEKLSEFAKDGQKNTDDLNLTDGFPVSKKPARQWFNWLFNSLTSKVNEIIDADFVPKADIVDNLTTDDATKPVSAKQAKNLQDNKLGKTENASSSSLVINRGDIPALAGPGEVPLYGLTLSSAYSNGYPTSFGNVLHLGGAGQGEILVGWPGVSGGFSPSFIRSKRDNLDAPWSPWREIVFQDTMPYQLVGLAKKLENPRAINGINFDGSTNITIYDETKLPLTGGTLTGPLTVNHPITVYMSDADGAFQKLIQGNTSTDSGYVAVGNHGIDKGYLELGTTDDVDTAIYVRKRRITDNAIFQEAALLDSQGNTSFPNKVIISNALGAICGLSAGNQDSASYEGCNIDLNTWWGLGIKGNDGVRRIVFDARSGDISTRGNVNASMVQTSNFYSGNAYSFYGLDGNTSQRIKCNSILASNAWADEVNVPELGIFARGNIVTAGTLSVGGANLQVVTGPDYTMTLDHATRLVHIQMRIFTNMPIYQGLPHSGSSASLNLRDVTLPITLRKRLHTQAFFTTVNAAGVGQVGEAYEWMWWTPPPGIDGATDSKVRISAKRWTGTTNEPCHCDLFVTGYF